MKKIRLLILILIALLPIAFAQVGNPNTECQSHGFEYGIAKFECGSSSASDGNGYGFSVSWGEGCSSVDWASSATITGVLSKEGTDYYVLDGGTLGTVNSNGKAISHITFCVDLETEEPINQDSRCEYYCPDPDYSSDDYWNITTTNVWCFQNGKVCEAAANLAGCEDIKHGSRNNAYWCSECRCVDVEDCDAPGRCIDNSPLPTCQDVGKLDCNGVPTYKDKNFGGNGCPEGCEVGPSCDGKCACGNEIEFAYCCEEVPIVCGDGICNLKEEYCEIVNGEGKICKISDEGKPPTGNSVDCRPADSQYECTICGDGIWQPEAEECDYACTKDTCRNGGYDENCKQDCSIKITETDKLPIETCTGQGDLYLYEDQFSKANVDFVIDGTKHWDQLLIFARGDLIDDLKVKIDGVLKNTVLVKSLSLSSIEVKVYSLDLPNLGADTQVSILSNSNARSIQGYLAQKKASPVYDLETLEFVGEEKHYTDYLPVGRDDYVIFDKYTYYSKSALNDKIFGIKINASGKDYLDRLYSKPSPDQIEGAIVTGFNSDKNQYYTLDIAYEEELCKDVVKSECFMYGIQDQGALDSIFFVMDVLAENPIPTQINRRNGYDIEAMAKHPITGKIYGFSGDQGDSQSKKKLLIIDRVNGIPALTDSECQLDIDNNMELQAASFNPATNELWAAGDNTGLRVVSLTPGQDGKCPSTVKVPKEEVPRPPEDMFWDNEGKYLYLLYQSTSSSSPNGKIIKVDLTKQPGSRLEEVCTGIKSAEGMAIDLFGNIIVGYHHNNGNTIDVYQIEEKPDGSFACNAVASKIYENVEYSDVETMFYDDCSPVPELHCDSLYWMRPDCGIPSYTDIYCVQLTMGGSACVERWSANRICDFNEDGIVNDIDLTDMSLKWGSTSNVDLAIYDMDSDRNIDSDDSAICSSFFLHTS